MQRLVFAGLLLALCWLPVPFGSQRPWATYVAAIMLLSLVVLVLLGGFKRGWRCCRRSWLPLSLLAIPSVVCLLQLLMPTAVIDLPGFGARPPVATANTFDSYLYFAKALCCLAIAVLIITTVSSRRRAALVLCVVVGSGFMQAFYGLAMTLSGAEYGFLVVKYAGLGSATGTFVNPNHFAAYIIICATCCLGLLCALLMSRTANRSAVFYRVPKPSLLLMLKVALSCLSLAIVLSTSRSANVVFLVVIVGGIAYLGLHRRRHSLATRYLVAFFITLNLAAILLLFGIDNLIGKFASHSAQPSYRFGAYADALAMVWQHPLLGWGGGVFDTAFTQYHQPQQPVRFMHLHNDHLQLLIEFGWLAWGALAFLCLRTAHMALKLVKLRASWQIKAVGFTFVPLLLWLLLHSIVDFSLQITAVACTLSALIALVWAAAAIPSKRH